MLDHGQWSKENEKFILSTRDGLIHHSLLKGYSVIVDDTNFAPKHEETLKAIAAKHEAEFVIKDFTDVPLEECLVRNHYRTPSVESKVIHDMYDRYLKPKIKPIEQDENLPLAVQFDLDGTLALYDNPNNIKSLNYDREFLYDRLNEPVFEALQAYKEAGYKIIIASGRNGEFEEVTKQWLAKHYIEPDLFIMRMVGDKRKDYIVKKEMFKEHIAPKYNVRVVYDDRDQVVDLWRSMGLTCFQVAPGSF